MPLPNLLVNTSKAYKLNHLGRAAKSKEDLDEVLAAWKVTTQSVVMNIKRVW